MKPTFKALLALLIAISITVGSASAAIAWPPPPSGEPEGGRFGSLFRSWFPNAPTDWSTGRAGISGTGSARFSVFGLGKTSGSFALDVKDGSGSSLFTVRDDGLVSVMSTIAATLFSGTGSGLFGILPSGIATDSSNRFVTDAEKTTWNAKQAALGYIPVSSTGSYADPAWVTSLAGSKITGDISGSAATATTATNVAWSGITGAPTTLAGYGITDAQGTLGYTAVNKAGDSGLGAMGIGGTGSGKLTVIGTGTGSATYGMVVANQASASNFVVRDDGNVGIGTASPGGTLEIKYAGNAAINTSDILKLNVSGGAANFGSIQFTDNATYSSWLNFNNNRLSFSGPGAGESLVINGSGNVGIGTAAPPVKLAVGLVAATSPYGMIGVKQTSAFPYNGIWIESSTNSKAITLGHTGTYASLSTNYALGGDAPYSNLVLQENGGNVGIGTTSPGTKLQVYGANQGAGATDYSASVIRANSLLGTANAISSILSMYDGNTIYGADIGYLYDGTGYKMTFGTNNDTSGNPATALTIDRSGNVGIGTTGPNDKLEVSGTGSTFGIRATGDGISSLKLYSTNANAGTRNWILATNQTAFGDLNIMQSSTQGGDPLAGTSRIYLGNSGSVGIGTTTPRAKLEVGTGGLLIGAAGSDTYASGGYAQFGYTAAAQAALQINASGNLGFWTDNGGAGWVQKMVLTNGGNLGVGTTGPTYSLQVLKPTTAGNTFLAQNLGQEMVKVNTEGVMLSSYPTGSGTDGIYIKAFDSGWNQRDVIKIINASAATSPHLLLQPSGGNVGIGTTNPGLLLSLNKSSGGISPVVEFKVDDVAKSYIGVSAGSGGVINGSASGDTVIRNQGQKIMLSADSGTTAQVTINAAGNVGIGTTTLNRLLTLYKSGAATDAMIQADAAQPAVLYLGDVNTAVYRPSSTTDLRLYQGGADVLSIKSGNVGIGITDPSTNKLNIVGNTSTTGLKIRAGGAGGVPMFDLADGNGNNPIYVSNDGKMGIGTASPGATLDVRTSRVSGANANSIYLSDAVTGAQTVGYGSRIVGVSNAGSAVSALAFETGGAGANNDTQISFYTQLAAGTPAFTPGNQRMVIAYDGNVGIGTANPGYKLDVNGAINATSLLVNGTALSGTQWSTGTGGVISYSSGNVGIGTTTPDNPLTVISGDSNGIKINATATNRPSLLFGNLTTGLLTQQTVTNTADWQLDVGVGAGVRAIEAKANGNVLLSQSAGNVGIGTPTPSKMLTIGSGTSAAKLHIRSTNQQGIISLRETGNTHGLDIGMNTANGNIMFDRVVNDVSTNVITIDRDTNGNVGIGTADPTEKLTVSGNVQLSGQLAVGVQSVSGLQFINNGTIGTIDALPLMFRTGSAEQMRITTTGNVGIGTTNPGQKLEVVGHIGASGTGNVGLIVTTTGADGNNASLALNGGAANASWTLLTNRSDLNGAADSLGFYKGAGTTGVKMVINDAGNVGIGTLSPVDTLQVNGGISLGGDTVAGNRTRLYEGNGLHLDSGVNTRPILFEIDSAEKMRIDTSGNVGIGTTSPAFDANGASGGTYLTLQSASTLSQMGVSLNQASTTGYLGGYAFVNAGLGTTEKRNAAIFGANDGATNSGNMQFWTANAGALGERMRVTSAGNVGIGTTNPGTYGALESWSGVASGASVPGNIAAVDTSAMAAGVGGQVTYAGQYINGTYTYAAYTRAVKENATSGEYGFGLALGTRANGGSLGEVMRLTSTGNVGIGTPTPTGKLNIGYTIDTAPLSYTNGGNEGFVINATRDVAGASYLGTVDFVAGRGSDATNGGSQFRFLTQPRSAGAPAVAMLIDKSGNVGIGTTGPDTKLHVSGGRTHLEATDGYALELTSQGGGTASYHYIDSSGNLTFTDTTGYAAGHQLLTIQQAGNVGIGTASPGQKLDVAGYVQIRSGNRLRFPTADLTSNFADIYSPTDEGATASPIAFRVGAGEALRIQSGGNVGIGTVAPTARLTVSDSVSTRLIHLNSTGTNGVGVGLSNSDVDFGYFGSAKWVAIGSSAIGDLALSAVGNLYLGANNTTRVSILSGGNVGIGTASPGSYRTAIRGSDDTSSNYGLWVSGATSATGALVVRNDGLVGIGQLAGTEKLEVNGNVKATAFLYSSDLRLKENISTLPNALDKISALRGVSFNWKEGGKADVGVIAQEVEAVYPELVKTGGDGYKSVEYGNLVGPLIEAVKELKAQNEALTKRVEELESVR